MDAAVPVLEAFFQWLFIRAETAPFDQLEVREHRKISFMEDLWANMEGDIMHVAIGWHDEPIASQEDLESINWRFYHYQHKTGTFRELAQAEVEAYDERKLAEARQAIAKAGGIREDPYFKGLEALLLSMNRWPHALLSNAEDSLGMTIGAGNSGWGGAQFTLLRKDAKLEPQGPVKFYDTGP